MATRDHYDLIAIGSGPGGGALAHWLAPTGKRVLMMERGGYPRRSGDKWDAKTVFLDGRYQAPNIWYGKNGEAIRRFFHFITEGRGLSVGSPD